MSLLVMLRFVGSLKIELFVSFFLFVINYKSFIVRVTDFPISPEVVSRASNRY